VELAVGDIVKVNRSFLGSTPGEPAFVYEVYTDFDDESKLGVSIITKSGKDLGGFSHQEQEHYLEKVCSSGIIYEFQNVMQLDRDFKSGVFNEVFGL
jgi:hypothetical protein